MDGEMKTPSVPTCDIGHPLDESVLAFKQLIVTFLKLQRQLETVLDPHGIVLSQFEALCKIGAKPGMIQQELVSLLLVTKGNVGALLDRLASMGLVERRADPADRRANRLYLTEAGASTVSQILRIHWNFLGEIFMPMPISDRVELRRLLKVIEPA